MRVILVVVSFIALASARPDIGLKLRELQLQQQQQQQQHSLHPPATSYGVPTGSYLPSNQNNQFAGYDQFSSSIYQTGSTASNQQHSAYDSNSNKNYNAINSASGGSPSYADYESSFGGGISSEFGSTSTSVSGGQVQVQKHVYFYEAPEDEYVPQLRVRVQPQSATKNYKIIFIKAPTYKSPAVPQIPVQQADQEKTVVYVLVKKPDETQDIVIPTVNPVKPSKPEVYFIKYKSQKEAEEKIQGIKQGANLGVSANSVASDSAFINSITDSQDAGGISSQTGSVFTSYNQNVDHSQDHQLGTGSVTSYNQNVGQSQDHQLGTGSVTSYNQNVGHSQDHQLGTGSVTSYNQQVGHTEDHHHHQLESGPTSYNQVGSHDQDHHHHLESGTSTSSQVTGGWYVLRDWSMESFDYKQTLRFLHVKFGVTPYFKIDVVPNPMSPGNSSISISPAGLGLPDRSYYYLPFNHTIITAYKQLIRDVVINLGSPTARAEKLGNDIFFYEQRIAEITPDSSDLLNPVTTYNPIKMSELKYTTSTLPLQDILSEMFPSASIEPDTEVIVTNLDYLYKISQIMSSTDRITMNSYMIWTLVRNYLPYLSSSMTTSVNTFRSDLFGLKQPLQRWEFCANLVQKFMPEAVDFMLEQKNPIQNKTVEIVEKMFNNIKEVAKMHLKKYISMPDLHNLLHKKLKTLKLQIGMRNLNKSVESLKHTYGGLSVLKTNLFETYKNGIYFLRKNKEIRLVENRKEDFIVNLAVSYPYKVKYLPSSNMIIVPRALLSPPGFENEFPPAVLYGRLGVEMALGIASSILPYESLWTSSLKLLTPFHSTVNESLRLVRYQTHCLTNIVKLNGFAASEQPNITALTTFKYLSALKLAYEGLHLHVEKSAHLHQPSLETFEDPTLFYLTHMQNLCSKTTKQQELYDNLVHFKLAENALLKTAWMQESTVSESFECNFSTDKQCSDIF